MQVQRSPSPHSPAFGKRTQGSILLKVLVSLKRLRRRNKQRKGVVKAAAKFEPEG